VQANLSPTVWILNKVDDGQCTGELGYTEKNSWWDNCWHCFKEENNIFEIKEKRKAQKVERHEIFKTKQKVYTTYL